MSSKRAVAQILKQLVDAGVTHLPKVDVTSARSPAQPSPASSADSGALRPGHRADRPSVVRETPAKTGPVAPARGAAISGAVAPLIMTNAGDSAIVRPEPLPEIQELMARRPSTMQQKTDALCALAKTVAGCRRCQELASTRTQTVFGVGNPDARIMFIGEAPGADEDAQGEPFVGRAGQLLNKIIEASKLTREEIYICNILRCRPPGNRNPLPQEAANCREFLDGQIQIVKPEYIVCWGTVAAQNLLNETRAVGKLRGQFFEYQGARVICTYHPSYLLRNPSAKKLVWDDMKFFMAELGVELQS